MRDGFIAQLLAGIGGVGNQFAEKNLLIRIDRMDDQVQEPRHIGIERAAFLTVLISHSHAGNSPIASDNHSGMARAQLMRLRRCRAANRCSVFDELV